MTIAEQVTRLKTDFDEVRASALNECASRHYVMEFTGDNSGQVTFQCPFEPDAVAVIGFDPFAYSTSGFFTCLVVDRRSFGRRAGALFASPSSGILTTPKGVLNCFQKIGDGEYKLHGFYGGSGEIIFDARVKYQLVASKYTDKTDKERIIEFVEGLPDGGTDSITMYADKVNANFTEDEWATLIAKKPSYTFVMW